MAIEVLASDKPLGAEVVGVDLSRPIDEAAALVLRRAVLDRLVLRVREQRLSDEALVAVARIFGAPELSPRSEVSDAFGEYATSMPEVTIISNIEVDGQAIGSLGAGEADWHADMTFTETPPSICILYALELPAEGGNTQFASMYHAAETLAPETRARIAGRLAVHDYSMTSAGDVRKGFAEVTDVRETPGARHPILVRHPETGREAMLLGRRRNSWIVGLEVAESEALLDQIWAQATRRESAWEQVWRTGDMIIWDNRSVMHRRDPFDSTARRLLHRTQVKGSRPAP